MKKTCVGCLELSATTTRVLGLGHVCEYCLEVLPIVYETEIERVREARRKLEEFVASLEKSA